MRTTLIALFFAISCLGFAQADYDDVISDRLPARPILISEDTPILIRIVDNQWGRQCANLSYNGQTVSFYQNAQLVAMIAEKLSKRRLALAKDTTDILSDAAQRRAMEKDEYVDGNSPIFTKGSIKPAVYILEVTTGGTASSKRDSAGIRVGGVRVGGTTESGSSNAFISVSLVKRTSLTTVGTVTGQSKYSSVNVENFDFSKSRWFSTSGVGYIQQASPGFRRGMVSTARALEDLDRKLDSLFTNRDGLR